MESHDPDGHDIPLYAQDGVTVIGWFHIDCFRVLTSPPPATLFPYTTLFRSLVLHNSKVRKDTDPDKVLDEFPEQDSVLLSRSEEHTSELQSRLHLVCRLLLEKKNKHTCTYHLGSYSLQSSARLSHALCPDPV